MSILDKASIITTPTAYEDGKLLSLKPSSALGSQLCTNGTFDTDSDWSKTNATISGGKANFDISSGAYAKVEQSKSYTSGKVHVLTAIVNGTAGKKMRFRDDTANNGGLTSSTGQITMDGTDQSVEFRFTANANSDTIAIERQDNESDDNYSFTVDNVSLKEDTSADLEFVRGSLATRFNEQRLIEDVNIISEELVTNGTFNTDSDWTKGTGWSISGGTANQDGSNGILRQTSVLPTNTKAKVTFDLSNYGGSGDLQVKIAPNIYAVTLTGNRSYTVSTDGTNSTNGDLQIITSNGFTGSIDNVSVKEITEATNLPRIDFTGGGCPSLLLEPQSTNIVPTSEVTPQSTSNVTTTASFGTSPEGIQNSLKVQKNGVNANDRIFPISNYNATLVSGNKYSMSAFVKNIDVRDTGVTTIGCRINGATFFRSSFEWDGINISISSSFTSGTRTNVFANSYGNGWWRIGLTFQADGTSGNFELDVDRNFGTDTTSIETWGWQLEELPYVSSYIPTSGSAATRLKDLVSRTGLQDHINDTEGVLYAEISGIGNDSVNRHISLSDGSADNRIFIQYNTDNNLLQQVRSGGTEVAAQTTTISDITDNIKAAVKYKENDFAFWVNGVEVGTDTSGAAPTGLNKLSFDIASSTSTPFHGRVKALIVFNEALSDAELTALTS